MSLYDYPAIVDYILNVTRQPNLYAVGHSQVEFPAAFVAVVVIVFIKKI